MAIWASGSPALTSTQAEQSNPSTSALIAAITGLRNEPYELRVVCGASTNAKFIVEQSASSTLSDAIRDTQASGHLGRRTVFTATNGSAQYVLRFKGESGDIVRLRCTDPTGAAITAAVAGTIQVEPLA